LDFLQAQPASTQAIPDLRAFLAYFQSKCSQADQALDNYAAIFGIITDSSGRILGDDVSFRPC